VIPGWTLSGAPESWPFPITKLKTPFGSPTESITSANSKADKGVNSEGFKMQVHPAARHGATWGCK
jgi:hypothetical protein